MSKGQASSPYVGRSRDRSVNSGKNKQLQTYDPAYAGRQIAEQGNAGQGALQPAQDKQGAGRVQPANQGQPPRYPAPIPPRLRRGAGYNEQPANRYDDNGNVNAAVTNGGEDATGEDGALAAAVADDIDGDGACDDEDVAAGEDGDDDVVEDRDDSSEE